MGGNRTGELRRYVNLFITMLLGGLWHGAGWTYILWGGLHGTFLSLNHGWRKMGLKMPSVLAWILTFNTVMFSWVVFRAANMQDAAEIFKAMLGMKGIVLTNQVLEQFPWLGQSEIQFADLTHLPANYEQSLILLVALLVGVITLPNTQQIMKRFKPN